MPAVLEDGPGCCVAVTSAFAACGDLMVCDSSHILHSLFVWVWLDFPWVFLMQRLIMRPPLIWRGFGCCCDMNQAAGRLDGVVHVRMLATCTSLLKQRPASHCIWLQHTTCSLWFLFQVCLSGGALSLCSSGHILAPCTQHSTAQHACSHSVGTLIVPCYALTAEQPTVRVLGGNSGLCTHWSHIFLAFGSPYSV